MQCYTTSADFAQMITESARRRCTKQVVVSTSCVGCGVIFVPPKQYQQQRYCSRACYRRSSQLKQHLASYRVFTQVTLTCEQCGVTFCRQRAEAQKPTGKARFCSQGCWRQYFAYRFDRWIANPEAIPLPHNYDEFLTQEELPCLIDGCDWKGKHLGIHVNHAHGIDAATFKKMAGFNHTTALATDETLRKLSDAQQLHDRTNFFQAAPDITDVSPMGAYERRLEAREHQAKAIRLNAAHKRANGLNYRNLPNARKKT